MKFLLTMLLTWMPLAASAGLTSYRLDLFCEQNCNDDRFGTQLSSPLLPISSVRFQIEQSLTASLSGVFDYDLDTPRYQPFRIGDISFRNTDAVGSVLPSGQRGVRLELIDGQIVGIEQLFARPRTQDLLFDFYTSLGDPPNVPGGRFWALRFRQALPDGGSIQDTVEGRYRLSAIPEPGTVGLILLGLTGLALRRRGQIGQS